MLHPQPNESFVEIAYMAYHRFLNTDKDDQQERLVKALTLLWTQFVDNQIILISPVGTWERPEIHASNTLSFV